MTERTFRGAIALVCAFALAGCEGSISPTALPAAPSFDGGMGYGSGNRTQEDGEGTAAATAGAEAGADSVGRSGMGYGSGN